MRYSVVPGGFQLKGSPEAGTVILIVDLIQSLVWSIKFYFWLRGIEIALIFEMAEVSSRDEEHASH